MSHIHRILQILNEDSVGGRRPGRIIFHRGTIIDAEHIQVYHRNPDIMVFGFGPPGEIRDVCGWRGPKMTEYSLFYNIRDGRDVAQAPQVDSPEDDWADTFSGAKCTQGFISWKFQRLFEHILTAHVKNIKEIQWGQTEAAKP